MNSTGSGGHSPSYPPQPHTPVDDEVIINNEERHGDSFKGGSTVGVVSRNNYHYAGKIGTLHRIYMHFDIINLLSFTVDASSKTLLQAFNAQGVYQGPDSPPEYQSGLLQVGLTLRINDHCISPLRLDSERREKQFTTVINTEKNISKVLVQTPSIGIPIMDYVRRSSLQSKWSGPLLTSAHMCL